MKNDEPFGAQLYKDNNHKIKRYVNNTCKNFFAYNKQFFFFLTSCNEKEGVEKTTHSSLFFF